MNRQIDEMTAEEIKEFQNLFCKRGKFFSLQKDQFNRIKYSFEETIKVTLPAPLEMITWLKERGFEL
jgi:hypothetical protein